MQVELAEVEARIAGAGDPEDAVRVGLVVVAQAARVVDESTISAMCGLKIPVSSGFVIISPAVRSDNGRLERVDAREAATRRRRR